MVCAVWHVQEVDRSSNTVCLNVQPSAEGTLRDARLLSSLPTCKRNGLTLKCFPVYKASWQSFTYACNIQYKKKKKKQYFQSSKSLEVNVSVELKINKVQFCSLNISPGVLVHTARLDLTHYSSSHKTATQKHLQTVSCYSVSKPKIQNWTA